MPRTAVKLEVPANNMVNPTTEKKPENNLNIYQRLARIRENVKFIKNDAKGYGYTYVTEENILTRIQDDMLQYGISLIPRIVQGTEAYAPRDTFKTVVPKDGGQPYKVEVNEVIVNGELMFTWINDANPEEKIEVPWYYIGQQSDASQAYGSALTYASRYFLLRYFNIATADDPDKIRSMQKAEQDKQEKKLRDELVAKISEVIEEAAKDENKRPRIGKIVEDRIGDRDYNNVKTSVEAAMLLDDLNKAFKNKEEK